MQDVSSVDKNFKIETNLNKPGIKFYDVNEAPFKIYGVYYHEGLFRRLPEEVAKATNGGVHALHCHTAGGRVRFRTDSPYIAINVKMPAIGKMPHFALTGSAGFDMYERLEDGEERYVKSFVPPFNISQGYESVIELDGGKIHDITINFPLYSAVSQLYIGLSEDAVLLEPNPYKITVPFVYYGSSITQGGCASRPGNSYQSRISREFDADYVNLGFSGSARGEDAIADYIKDLDMSVFVLDYDHNAPSVEELEATHEKLFAKVRKTHPEIPIIIMSRPKYYLDDEEKQRLEIIRSTWKKARMQGDERVYILDGRELMEFAENEGTVDNCHPNDLGFASMAKALSALLKKIIK